MRNKSLFLILLFFTYIAEAKSPASLANMGKAIEEFKNIDIAKKKPVVVAVIDTGADISHQALKDSLWVNKGEIGKDSQGRDKASNGIDDDNNGYIDDLSGWNFIGENNNLSDHHGHGTHVSGIVLGKSHPAVLDQLNLPIKIMVLKYFDPKMDFTKTIDYTVKAIEYAINNGADIINYSSGGYVYSRQEKAAIQKAKDKGILFVTAAGNEGQDIDKKSYYPAKYGLTNIISVAALDKNKQRIKSSNYGRTVNAEAVGKNVMSAVPGGGYKEMTGTSQATASISRKMVFMKLMFN